MSSPSYDAFISYRHVPRDIAVASEIQKQLERFRIPPEIRRQTGRTRMEKIFRDKEELPVTSDLQENICEALENSKYLIVICSPDTKESFWVQREIDYFQTCHSYKEILTVIAAGDDPEKVIPESLLYEEKDGVLIPTEPLSCDYRGSFRKANKQELPRLAAVILGCAYDDLRQRQRQYRARRLTAVMSVLLVFLAVCTAYLLWSRQKINENLRMSQINESRFLANAAMEELGNGNRILAAKLALQALPSEQEPDRPVITEAERALSEALFTYRLPLDDNVGAIRVFDFYADIIQMRTDPEKRRLITLDRMGLVTVRDIDTGRTICSFSSRRYSWKDFIIGAEGCIILMNDLSNFQPVCCYDAATGEEKWEIDSSIFSPLSISETVALRPWYLSEDKETLYLYQNQYTESGERLISVNVRTGEILSEWSLDRIREKTAAWKTGVSRYCRAIEVFKDESLFAMLEEGPDDVFYLLLFDEEEFCCEIQLSFKEVYAINIDLRQHLVVCGRENNEINGNKMSAEMIGDYHSAAICYDRDGRQLWKNDITTTLSSFFAAVFSGTFKDGITYKPVDSDVIVLGNTISFMDPDTGAGMGTKTLCAPFIFGDICKKAVRGVLLSGDLVYFSPNNEKVYPDRIFGNEADAASFIGGYLNEPSATACILSGGKREIITYQGGQGDERIQAFTSDPEIEKNLFYGSMILYEEISDDIGLVLTETYDAHTALVHVLDLEQKRIKNIIPLPGIADNWKWLSWSEDSGFLTLLYQEGDRYNLMEVSLKCVQIQVDDGAVKEEEILIPLENAAQAYMQDVKCAGDHVFLLINTYGNGAGCTTVWNYHTESGKLSRALTEEREEELSDSKILRIFPSNTGDLLLLGYDNGQFATVNTDQGELHLFDRDIRSDKKLSREITCDWSEDDAYILVADKDRNEILLADSSGTVQTLIPCIGRSPVSVYIGNEELMVLFEDAYLEMYDISNGALRGKIKLDNTSHINASDYRWNRINDHELQLSCGSDMYFLDTVANTCRQIVPDCLGYSAAQKVFVIDLHKYTHDTYYGWYSQYDTADLISMGHDLTDGQPISQNDRQKYGLGED